MSLALKELLSKTFRVKARTVLLHTALRSTTAADYWEETAAQQLSFLNSNTEGTRRAFENRDQDEENEIKKLQNLHK